MKWRESSEQHAARMRLKNAVVPRIGQKFFWDRVATDLIKAHWKTGPKRRLSLEPYMAAKQLEITGPMLEVKATKRG